MEFVYELGLFTAQLVVVAVVIVVSLLLIVAANKGRRGQEEGYIEVRSINDRYEAYVNAIREITEDEHAAKARAKRDKQSAKADQKAAKKKAKSLAKGEEGTDPNSKPRIFVLTFEGDVNASQTETLREEISAVLPEATSNDTVLIRLESPGGVVHGYGLAASQLQRIKDAGVELIVAVDKVAASGGYMMACVGSKILAAPFAIIGSVGVVAQLPNFHRLLKKNDIDFETFTAGEFKRTVTIFGENTDKGRRKFESELEETHQLFKSFVSTHRPNLDIDHIATGEIWYGQQAIDNGLIDEVMTSDAYLQANSDSSDLVEVRYRQKQKLAEKLGVGAENMVDRMVTRLWKRLNESKLP